ncbi:sugar phosphate isomerase/epimerase [Paenibacillus sp. CF384]|uniref:sugar phosphate isomerase/epimerase family protein n=1 Tax=Paenibacillus sp. CF384 TaxID=1884382 RepID=UPI00089B5B77|nr:sugar phosphate isomerase/epimerase [Paenibacillus sp. CF384]SDX44416.1 Sugar phosphate isomerase/epimerase [Paenibacillus sp. CF384]
MYKKQIAAQLYTLRDYCKTAEDLDAALKRVKAIGYDAVQVSGIGPIAPDEVKRICDSHGLAICATHVPTNRLLNDLDALIAEHQAWGCQYIGIGSIPPEYRNDKAGYTAFGDIMNEIGDRLADAGLELIYHNHKFEFEKFEGKTGMDWLLNAKDSPSGAFSFELDTYWVQAGGADPVSWIMKVADMKVVHLKDMAIVNDQQVFAAIGEGNLNWPAIIEACRETGVEWYVVEQDVCPGDPFESLEISYRALQQLAYQTEEELKGDVRV